MNTTDNNTKKKTRIVPKGRVKIIVQREFIGEKSIVEAMLPIVMEDMKTKVESHTFDLSA